MPDGIPSPNPQFPQPIKNVTGNANVKIQNKNLLPFTNQEFTIKGMNFKVVNGKFIVNGTASGEISSVSTEFKEGFSFILDAGTYYLQKTSGISAYIRKYSDNTIIQQNVGVFTITEKTKVFYGIYMASGTTLNNVLNKDQLEQGSTATSYVPHQEQNYPFTFSEGQRGMQGTTLEDDGIQQKRKQIVLDGTETGWVKETFTSCNLFKKQFTNMKTSNNGNGLSTHFTNYKRHNQTIGAICFGWSDNLIYFYVSTAINTIEKWKAYLAEQYANDTPVIVEYELAKEEKIPYNETQQAQYNAKKEAISYYEQTNISGSSSELSPIITASAVGDLNLILDTMQSKIDLLEG